MTKRQIENSLDYKTYGRTIKTLVAMWAVFAVLVLFVMAFVLMPTTNVGVVFLYAAMVSVGAGVLAISGPVIYCIVKRTRMLKNIDEYKCTRLYWTNRMCIAEACATRCVCPMTTAKTSR